MSQVFLLIFVALLTDLPISNGISCYVCEKTTSEKTCISGERLVHDRLKGGRFVRNCTSDNYCLIEAIINAGGAYVSYMRSCTDGFYTGQKVEMLAKRVKPDNLTECAYDLLSGFVFCVTLCHTDYCNGPRPCEISTAVKTDSFISLYSVVALIVYKISRR